MNSALDKNTAPISSRPITNPTPGADRYGFLRNFFKAQTDNPGMPFRETPMGRLPPELLLQIAQEVRASENGSEDLKNLKLTSQHLAGIADTSMTGDSLTGYRAKALEAAVQALQRSRPGRLKSVTVDLAGPKNITPADLADPKKRRHLDQLRKEIFTIQGKDYKCLKDVDSLEEFAFKSVVTVPSGVFESLPENLSRVTLDGVRATDEALGKMPRNLRSFSASNGAKFNGSGLSGQSKLETLSFDSCENDANGMAVVPRSLTELHVSQSTPSFGVEIGALPELPKLKKMTLAILPLFGDTTLLSMKPMSALEHLNLLELKQYGMKSLSDEGLKALADKEKFPSLKKVGLTKGEFGDEAINFLQNNEIEVELTPPRSS